MLLSLSEGGQASCPTAISSLAGELGPLANSLVREPERGSSSPMHASDEAVPAVNLTALLRGPALPEAAL